MTNEEFSNRFDVLMNSANPGNYLGFNEYDKSVLFTTAQEIIVQQIYDGNYESKELNREAIKNLITRFSTALTESSDTVLKDSKLGFKHFVPANVPTDIWWVTFEQVQVDESSKSCVNDKMLQVSVATYDEFYKMVRNPFRRPNNSTVIRLDTGDNSVEIVSALNLDKYIFTYIKKPSPIIFGNLDKGLYICGVNTESTTNLSESIHESILMKAVELAQASLARKV